MHQRDAGLVVAQAVIAVVSAAEVERVLARAAPEIAALQLVVTGATIGIIRSAAENEIVTGIAEEHAVAVAMISPFAAKNGVVAVAAVGGGSTVDRVGAVIAEQ